jgi:outer membrane lipoprotein-sorting protein
MRCQARHSGRLATVAGLTVLGLLVTRAVPAQMTSAPPGYQIAAVVEQVYRQAKTAQADFKTSYAGKGNPSAQGCPGHVVYQRNIGTVWTCSDGVRLPTQSCAALPTFGCFDQLTALLVFRRLEPSGISLEAVYVLEGTPKVPTPTYQKVLFYVDAASMQIVRVLFIGADGDRNRVDFANQTIRP